MQDEFSEINDEFLGEINDELLKLLLLRFISDLKIVESYRHKKDEKFNLPITAFHGKDDDRITLNNIKAWKKITSNKFNSYVLPGNHFFMRKKQSQKKLLELIVEELSVKN